MSDVPPGWRIDGGQLTNFRGYSQGLLSAVVVPAGATGFERPSIGFVAVCAIVLMVAGFQRPWQSNLGRRAYATIAAIAIVTLAAVLVAPLVSPYKVLLAPHTWMLLVALIYLPAVERAVLPWARTVAAGDATGWYAAGLVILALLSSPRMVGDGREYMAMAGSFRSLQWPSLETSTHFWLYSLLAAPLVALTDAIWLGPHLGFLLLNLLLLAIAFRAMASRFGFWPAFLLGAGPIIWWIDKIHAEPFMFSMMAIAAAGLRDRPWVSLIALGAAAAQNPAMAPLVPIAAAVTARRWAADRRWRTALLPSLALAIANPSYFMARGGPATPLLPAGAITWPSASKYFAVLFDPNIGVVFAFPGLVVALLLASWLRRDRRRLNGDELFSLAGGAVLLFAFAQVWNVNSGGTRDVSRYAIWLLPLCATWIEVPPIASPVRASLLAVCCASAALSVAWFQPALKEEFLRPTRAALFAWTAMPSWSHPIPEVFVERLRGSEGSWRVPVATPACEKVLLVGRDGGAEWPSGCSAATAPPPSCDRPGALCYANRAAAGYEFEVLSSY